MHKHDAVTRFWNHVDMDGPVPEYNEYLGRCWSWKGQIGGNGYGHFYPHEGRHIRAHRFSYVIIRGEIPRHLVLDHLCKNKSCVNPFHLEMVTNRINIMRGVGCMALNAIKTHCPRGHEFTADNLHKSSLKQGYRRCLKCDREYQRKRPRKKRYDKGV